MDSKSEFANKIKAIRNTLPEVGLTITRDESEAMAAAKLPLRQTAAIRHDGLYVVVDFSKFDDWPKSTRRLDEEEDSVGGISGFESEVEACGNTKAWTWKKSKRFSLRLILFAMKHLPGVDSLPAGLSNEEYEIVSNRLAGVIEKNVKSGNISSESVFSKPDGVEATSRTHRRTNLISAVAAGLKRAPWKKPHRSPQTRKNMTWEVANDILLCLLKEDAVKYAGMGEREMAKAVGCSRATLKKTPSHQNIGAVREELRSR